MISLFFVLFSEGLALGQTSSITGTVLDPRGNTVVGATITVTNNATSASHVTTSSRDGTYQILGVAPGIYHVRAEKQGFIPLKIIDVEITAYTPLTLNISFSKSGGSQQVVVSRKQKPKRKPIPPTLTDEELLAEARKKFGEGKIAFRYRKK